MRDKVTRQCPTDHNTHPAFSVGFHFKSLCLRSSRSRYHASIINYFFFALSFFLFFFSFFFLLHFDLKLKTVVVLWNNYQIQHPHQSTFYFMSVDSKVILHHHHHQQQQQQQQTNKTSKKQANKQKRNSIRRGYINNILPLALYYIIISI